MLWPTTSTLAGGPPDRGGRGGHSQQDQPLAGLVTDLASTARLLVATAARRGRPGDGIPLIGGSGHRIRRSHQSTESGESTCRGRIEQSQTRGSPTRAEDPLAATAPQADSQARVVPGVLAESPLSPSAATTWTFLSFRATQPLPWKGSMPTWRSPYPEESGWWHLTPVPSVSSSSEPALPGKVSIGRGRYSGSVRPSGPLSSATWATGFPLSGPTAHHFSCPRIETIPLGSICTMSGRETRCARSVLRWPGHRPSRP